MFRPAILAFLIAVFIPLQVVAQDKAFTLSSPNTLIESGFLRFLLPRFSLKTGIRVKLQTSPDGADAQFATTGGQPVMQGLGQRFALLLPDGAGPRHEGAQRFADWLFSEIGQRTIRQFAPDGGAPVFSPIAAELPEPEDVFFDGDARRGEGLSFSNCGRCHVITDQNRMKGIGSTPSFGLLRGLGDWQERFATFHLRRPHPAITQIEDMTAPFDPARPPPIHPLYLTLTEFNDILAYVSTITPADLGAPLAVHQ